MQLIGSGTTLDRTVVCYRLTDLRAGGTAVIGNEPNAQAGDQVVRRGDSMLAVLHTHHTEYLNHIEWVLRQPWNWGFGAEQDVSAVEARHLLDRVEELQRHVAERASS
jgi:hypothetical protein